MSTFEQDVKAYANYAAKFDTGIRQALANGDPRDAIRRIAGAYRVARNFPRRFDEMLGIPRYEPVVRALVAYPPSIGINPIEAVLRLTRDLQQIYHREVLSASSKFLWFAWGREIIIYDSQALATLRTRSPKLQAKDYPAYCAAWKALFTECSEKVANECARQGASNERWFHERVFDWYLWRSGSERAEKVLGVLSLTLLCVCAWLRPSRIELMVPAHTQHGFCSDRPGVAGHLEPMLGREGFDVNTPARKYRLKTSAGNVHWAGNGLFDVFRVPDHFSRRGPWLRLEKRVSPAKEMIGRG